MLALDGGGIRGLITLGVLERLEALLAEASGRGSDFRLHEFFDYIGGTSTGAIIAAGLARGLSVAQLRDFYLANGPAMFEPAILLERLKYLHDADPLRLKLREVFGADTTLRPEHLHCLLLIVTKNNSTDSPWPVSSNPDARYNDPARPDCNLAIPLWQIVRASTAAPVFFPPEELNWDPDDPSKKFIFVDGGVTPYNNPAFLLYRFATEQPYALEWQRGERNLLIVSVGTGAAPTISADVDQLIPGAIKTSATSCPAHKSTRISTPA
jgi:patatin-like phospholipase/acyl hydrolase